MTAGLSAANRAAAILNVYRGTAAPAIAPFVKLHTGDPGAAGTANASANANRNPLTFAAPAAGSMGLSVLGAYTMTATETITHVSIWDANTAGNFVESWPLSASVPVINGSTLTFSAFTLSYGPIAA